MHSSSSSRKVCPPTLLLLQVQHLHLHQLPSFLLLAGHMASVAVCT
jgi:hypothetical protein